MTSPFDLSGGSADIWTCTKNAVDSGIMEPATVRAIFQWYLRRLASEVEATEAFGYEMYDADGQTRFDLLAHIRPDNADAKVREDARKAFLALAEPCVRSNSPAVIETNAPVNGKSQFALISLLHEEPPAPRTSRVLFGVIVRCASQSEARAKLNTLRGFRPRNGS